MSPCWPGGRHLTNPSAEKCMTVKAPKTNTSCGSFGLSLDRIEAIVRTAQIDVRYSGNPITLSWDVSGFVLQSADSLEDSWTDVQGTELNSFAVEPSESKRFYRL